MAANRLLPDDMALRALWETRIYFLAFFAALAWALWRPPIRAAIELLAAASLATLLIPVGSALRAASHGIWLWPGVDAVAAASALAMAAMALATARARRRGDTAGVWR